MEEEIKWIMYAYIIRKQFHSNKRQCLLSMSRSKLVSETNNVFILFFFAVLCSFCLCTKAWQLWPNSKKDSLLLLNENENLTFSINIRHCTRH